jgi:prenyltransferase beta subunit
MTVRLDMYKTVNGAHGVLGDSAEAVRRFLRQQLAPDGGFRGRDGRSDLYYTVFGLEASLAMGVEVPRERVSEYLDGFGVGESLDLVHLAALIRCRANLIDAGIGRMEAQARGTIAEHLMGYRSQEGGFDMAPNAERGSAYGSFLALGAWQDLGVDCPDAEAVADSIASLQRPEGGYANEAAMTAGATPATAAAISVLHYLKRPVPESAIRWLLARAHPLGGFEAIPVGRASRPCSEGEMCGESVSPADFARDVAGSEARTPSPRIMPDLLSTATALHALSLIGVRVDDMRDKHLDYLDSLWNAQGGFRGHWTDDIVDCEYTYYGLLALGTLAL